MTCPVQSKVGRIDSGQCFHLSYCVSVTTDWRTFSFCSFRLTPTQTEQTWMDLPGPNMGLGAKPCRTGSLKLRSLAEPSKDQPTWKHMKNQGLLVMPVRLLWLIVSHQQLTDTRYTAVLLGRLPRLQAPAVPLLIAWVTPAQPSDLNSKWSLEKPLLTLQIRYTPSII